MAREIDSSNHSEHGLSGDARLRQQVVNLALRSTQEVADRATHIALTMLTQSNDHTDSTLALCMSLADALSRLGYYNQAQSVLKRISISPLQVLSSLAFKTCSPQACLASLECEHSFVKVPPTHFSQISLTSLIRLAGLACGIEDFASSFLVDMGGMANASANLIFSSLTEVSNLEVSKANEPGLGPAHDDVERLNIDFLENPRPLPWDNIIHSTSFGIVTTEEGCPKRLEPIGTTLVDKNVGSMISHVYCLSSVIVAPVYSGWVSGLEAIILIDIRKNYSISIANELTPLSKAAADVIDRYVVNILSAVDEYRDQDSVSRLSPMKYLLVGQRVNYGHTIINDVNCLAILCSLQKTQSFGIVLGNWDFVSTVELISNSHPQALAHVADVLLIDDCNSRDDNIYNFIDKILFPAPSFRPPVEALQLIWGYSSAQLNQGNETREQPTLANNQAVYIALDNRRGSRDIRNKNEILEVIATSCAELGIDNVFLDGMTLIPTYSRRSDRTVDSEYREASLPRETHDAFTKACKARGLNPKIIDGHSFPDKLEQLSQVRVVCALVPYGSSMMFPIYVINCRIGIFGYELYSNVLSAWAWHVTRFCHQRRVIKEKYIDSTSHSNSGYIVDLGKVCEFIAQSNDLQHRGGL